MTAPPDGRDSPDALGRVARTAPPPVNVSTDTGPARGAAGVRPPDSRSRPDSPNHVPVD